jgi:hypothetical protein
VQRLARRALIANGGTATTSQILEWTGRRRSFAALPGWGGYGKLHIILEQIGARKIGRAWKAHGQPWLWHLRDTEPGS